MTLFQGGPFRRNIVHSFEVEFEIKHICHTLDICDRCGYSSCVWTLDRGRRTCDGAGKRTALRPDEMAEWTRGPRLFAARGQPFLTTSMRLRNKTVVYVEGLRAATPKGAGGGAELRHAVCAAAVCFMREGTEDYFEVVISMEPGTKQPKDFGLIMMGSVGAAQDFMDAALAKKHGSRGHWGTIKVCQEYVGVCVHDQFAEQDWVPVPAVNIPQLPKEFRQHFDDINQLCGDGGSASSTKRRCSIGDKQLDVPDKKSHLEDEAPHHDVSAPKDLRSRDNSAVRLWFPQDLIRVVGGMNKAVWRCCKGMTGIKLGDKNGVNFHHQRQHIDSVKHQQNALTFSTQTSFGPARQAASATFLRLGTRPSKNQNHVFEIEYF